MLRLYFDGVGFALGKDTEPGSVYVQGDMECTGMALALGVWGHEHPQTDGSVDCPVCDKSSGQMMIEAFDALMIHQGEYFENPWSEE